MAEFRDATQGYAVLTGVILTQKKKKKEQLQLYFRTLHIFLCNLEGEINAQVYLGRKLMWV